MCAGDQPANAAKLQRAGMARAIHHKALTATNFLQLLREMLTQPSARGFADAAVQMQEMALAHAATNRAAAGEGGMIGGVEGRLGFRGMGRCLGF